MYKETILKLLASIPDMEDKLDVLTSIELATQDEEILSYVREIRNELCDAPAPSMGDFL
jgi:hypothetical protein